MKVIILYKVTIIMRIVNSLYSTVFSSECYTLITENIHIF